MKKFLTPACFAIALIASLPFLINSAYGKFAADRIGKTPVREANVKGRYSMMIPEYLTQARPNDLNSEASLEYENIAKEVYIIVIDEPKQDFKDVFLELNDYDTTKSVLRNYADAQMESIRGNVEKMTYESPERSLKTASGNAIVYDMTATQADVEGEMGFTVAFVEGRLNLYFIMTWSFSKDKAIYQQDMDNMIRSFKELSGDLDDGIEANYTVSVKSLYSMTVIGSMTEDTLLNDEASLEFADYNRELYTLVIDEPSTEFIEAYKKDKLYDEAKTPLDNYANIQREAFANNLKSINELSGLTKGKVNGLECRRFTMRGYVEGIDEQIFYKFCLVQGKTNFYVVMTWTMASRREKNEADMDLMMNSFKEL